MNALEIAIEKAYASQGGSQEVNKAYLEFIKANFFIPVNSASDPAHPEVLFLQENEHIFVPVFTNRDLFDEWAVAIRDRIHVLTLTGVNLLKNIGDDVTVSLNIGSETYKEFNPAEIARMRSMVLKLFK